MVASSEAQGGDGTSLAKANGAAAAAPGSALAATHSRSVLESIQLAVLFLDTDLRLQSFTQTASDLFELVDADLGKGVKEIAPRLSYAKLPEDARAVLRTLAQAECRIADNGRQFLARILPYRSAESVIGGVVVSLLDVTATSANEMAMRATLRRFGEAQQLAGVGVWEWDPRTDEIWWSPVVYRLWGLPPGDVPPSADRPVHPDDRADYDAALARARETGELRAEWRVILPDRSVRWLAATGQLSRADGDRRLLGVTQDITERKQTETRLKLLLSELQHRVRNILAVVRSIVSRTVRSSDNIEDLAMHLDGRLNTLGRTQSVFARTGEASVDFEELVRDEMLALATHEDQVSIKGPSIRLRGEAAETFALALHELATNAVKYGALTTPEGRLSVQWRVVNSNRGQRLSVEWRESGVAAIDISPRRAGFGRELIERGLPYELGAQTSLEFAPGGVRALIELPLSEKVLADLEEEKLA